MLAIRSAGQGRSATDPGPAAGLAALERSVPGVQAAVEQRGLLPQGTQHPHQAGGGGAVGVVVGDDAGVLVHPEAAQGRGEVRGLRQRVTADGGPSPGGELGVEVDPVGARQMTGEMGVAAGGAVEGPAHVEQAHGVPALQDLVEAGGVDDRVERRGHGGEPTAQEDTSRSTRTSRWSEVGKG